MKELTHIATLRIHGRTGKYVDVGTIKVRETRTAWTDEMGRVYTKPGFRNSHRYHDKFGPALGTSASVDELVEIVPISETRSDPANMVEEFEKPVEGEMK